MGNLFDPSKPINYIVNLDANNLYGKSMSYPMPQSGFTSLTYEQWPKIEWLAQRENHATGFFIECALEYPPGLHDSHNAYPIPAERMAVTPSVLSEKQVEVARQYSKGLPQKEVKLLPSLLNKAKYVCH